MSDRGKSSGEARQRILEVARELFMTRGYRGVSTRVIAENVGVTQPALYHHFGGKEELYAAVLEHELATISRRLRAAVDSRDTSLFTRVELMATQLMLDADHDMAQMFHDLRLEVSEPTRERIAEAFFEAMVVPMVELLGNLEHAGEIVSAEELEMSPVERAFYVLGVVRAIGEGKQHRTTADDSVVSRDRAGTKAARLILHGLRQAGPHTP
jgi:AcrR family transcriptional regulator